MQLLERQDEWARAHLQALLHHKKVAVPPPFRMLRPGEQEEKPGSRVENDPEKIAEFFERNFGA